MEKGNGGEKIEVIKSEKAQRQLREEKEWQFENNRKLR